MSAHDSELDDDNFDFESSEGRPANNRAEEYDTDKRKPATVAGLDLDDLAHFIPDNADHTKASPIATTANGQKVAQADFEAKYKSLVKAWKENNPGYAPPSEPGHVSLKAPPGYYDEYVNILDAMLHVPGYLALSNAEIGKRTCKKFPGYAPAARIMDRPIPTRGPIPFRMKALLRDSKHNGLNLKDCDTLSKLKKGIRGAAIAKSAELSGTCTWHLTDTHLVVNGTARALCTDARGYKRVKVGRSKMDVDTFLAIQGVEV